MSRNAPSLGRPVPMGVVPAPPVRARKMAARKLRHQVSVWMSGAEYRRVILLRDSFAGERCFLLANGPSLAEMDLRQLKGKRIFLVNAGTNALGQQLSSATFHMVTDNNRYRRFAAEFEKAALQHEIEYRFYPFRCRRTWAALPERATRPYFLLSNPHRFVDRGMVTDPRHGYSGGATVLVSAAQLLAFLGFSDVYVIGCDLDYGGTEKYFYALQEKDKIHETDPSVVRRRNDMVLANEHFAVVRRFYEAQGRFIANAGRGGHLETLERVAYETVI